VCSRCGNRRAYELVKLRRWQCAGCRHPQRRHEIGISIAVGGPPGRLRCTVFTQSMAPRTEPTAALRAERPRSNRAKRLLRPPAGGAGVARQVGGPPALLTGGVEDFGPILAELLGLGGGALIEEAQDAGALR